MTAERCKMIEMVLRERLGPTELVVTDEGAAHVGHAGAGGAGHFRVIIVSERFRGQSRIAMHRLVNAALGHLFGTEIHALAIEARAPD
ncbi:MAG: BolA family protein [Steroidobacteraceae bacterium]